MGPFEWTDPVTVEEAIAQLSASARPKAGGVDLVDLMKERIAAPSRLVNLRAIPGLDAATDLEGGGLALGPLLTLARLAEHARVRASYPALADAALRAATPAVRNMATLGGNLLQRPRCWYFRQEAFPCRRKGGDTCFALEGRNAYHAVFQNDLCAIVHPSDTATALVAYGAELELQGPAGRRTVPLESVFVLPDEDITREHRLAPDELVVGVRLPAPARGARSAYLKQGERDSADWPLAAAAVVLELDGRVCRRASIVLGAAAPVPWRARAAEAALAGKRLDGPAAAQAARAAVAGARPLAENGYKVRLLEVITRRAITAAAGLPA